MISLIFWLNWRENLAENKPLIIAVDFDGTIVTHEYPRIGRPVPGAIETMKEFLARGDKLILWTMRSGEELADAVRYCEIGRAHV